MQDFRPLYVLQAAKGLDDLHDIIAVDRAEVPESERLEEVAPRSGDQSGLGLPHEPLDPVAELAGSKLFPDAGLDAVVGRIGRQFQQI